MTWIKTIGPAEATGALADLYEAIGAARHGVAEVHLAQSLHPRALRAHFDLYRAVVLSSRPLSRLWRERLAVVVSASNHCAYCIAHHSEALHQLGDDRVDDVIAFDPSSGAADQRWSDRDRALLVWAWRLASSPATLAAHDVAALRSAGWIDDEILDAALTVSYFSFVNRLVLGLGVHIEEGFEATCGQDAVADDAPALPERA